MNIPVWRDGRAVEGGGLENRCAQAPWVRILLPPPRGPDKRRFFGRDDREADGARLLSECGGYTPPRVQIPLSPPYEKACHSRERQAFFCLPNPGFYREKHASAIIVHGRLDVKKPAVCCKGPQGRIHGLSAPCPERPCAPDALRLVFCAAFLYSCGANRQGIRPGQSTREPPCVPI